MTTYFQVIIGDKTFPFQLDETGEKILIGRTITNDLALAHDASVSKSHARIIIKNNIPHIEDLGSRNGSKINDKKIMEPTPLHTNDIITIGSTTLRFELHRPPESENKPSSPVDTSSLTCAISVRDLEMNWGEHTRHELTDVETRRLAVLQDIAASLLNQSDLERLFQDSLDMIFSVIPARRGCLMILKNNHLDVKAVKLPSASSSTSTVDIITFSNTIRRKIIDEKTAVLTCNVDMDPALDGAESIICQGIKSIMCVPLWNEDNTFGLIYLDSDLHERAFNEENLRLLTSIANLITMKIENFLYIQELLEKKAMEKELEFASDVQQFLLPSSLPEIPELDIQTIYQTCLQLGGDYYHLFQLPQKNQFLFVIADVMGKGTAAALLTASLHAYLNTLCEGKIQLDKIVTSLNEYIYRLCDGQFFMTLFAILYDADNHNFQYCNAGHDEGILMDKEGNIQFLTEGGLLIGFTPSADYKIEEKTLNQGDLIFLYTDGLSEIQNSQDEMLGKDFITQFLKINRHLTCPELCDVLLSEIQAYRNHRPQHDDLTVISIKHKEQKSS